MKTSEIGLSLYQPIRETCFSGYVEVREERDRFVVGVEIAEQFEGDATLEIVLVSDSDDCMCSTWEIHRSQPLSSDKLCSGDSFSFALTGLSDPYFCVWYVVSGGAFQKGKVTARISDEKAPWFTSSTEVVECSGVME